MRKFSLSVAASIASLSLFFIALSTDILHLAVPLHFPKHYLVKKPISRLSNTHAAAPIILKKTRMTSNHVLQIDTNRTVVHAKKRVKKDSRFFMSTKENPAYIMTKNVNNLALSSTGAMVPYSGKVENMRENILCPNVGVGVGYKISSHVTVSAAYDGALLKMADSGHYNKNMSAAGVGLTIRF
ncbi:MAG: hypothetical protein Q8L78_05595 [Coxiellaceae bacterium]|nr:hypothetical protein [Coxiellaceae bacterium]